MTVKMQTPCNNHTIQPEPIRLQNAQLSNGELYNASSERIWTYEAVDRLIVGMMYGSYDLYLSSLHISLAYHGFTGLTDGELSNFWDVAIVDSPAFVWWDNMGPQDAEVLRVLDDIKDVLDGAGDIIREIVESLRASD